MLEAVSSRFLKPSVFQKKIDSEKKLFKTYFEVIKTYNLTYG